VASEYNGCVLIVDDDDRLRHLLSLALEKVGFDVLAAGTQQQLRSRLARTQPDALVLNLQRSETDGLDLLRHVRARQDLCTVPIVFLAGCDSDDFRWQTIRAGADWFGLRPLGMLELQTRVGKLIRLGRPRLKIIAACDCPLRSRRLKPTG
jgi:two-component system alkaline phosphatase synthesis response regulator PhoP